VRRPRPEEGSQEARQLVLARDKRLIVLVVASRRVHDTTVISQTTCRRKSDPLQRGAAGDQDRFCRWHVAAIVSVLEPFTPEM
jgi:hypothetical protein